MAQPCSQMEEIACRMMDGVGNGAKKSLNGALKTVLLRLEKTAKLAKENEFDFFGTTLTISPHKNADIINKTGESLGQKYNINFLYSDLKKENGYLNSIILSKEYNLYRQNYCGCRYSVD